MDWKLSKRVTGLLYGLSKDGKLDLKKASALFEKKTLPKAFKDAIDQYISRND
jgi:hypothetical protein